MPQNPTNQPTKTGCFTKFALLFTHSWRENKLIWFMPFPKGISAKWYTNNFIQGLNLDCQVYSQVTLKAPVPARSPKLSSNESVQYLDGWPF